MPPAPPGYGEMMMAATPDELIAAIGLLGDIDAIRTRVEQYRAAGADEICLVPATAGDENGERSLRALKGL